MTGVGETLRGAREEMGLSYQDVEESIKIRAVYLRAIEEERFEELPGAAYTKGFMRTYAKFLGLDGDAVIAAYLSMAAVLPEEPAPSAPRRLQGARPAFRRTALLATAAVAVIIVIVLSFYFNPAEQKPISDPPGLSEQNQPEDAAPPVTPEVSDEPAEPAEPVIIEGLVVEVAYSAPCWLDVRADGEPVFSGTKGEGESLRIEANEYVEFVSIGATEAITITKNGELLPGFTEHVTRNFRVTADVPRLAPPDGGQDE